MIIKDYLTGDEIYAIHKCDKKATKKIITLSYRLIYLCDECYKNMFTSEKVRIKNEGSRGRIASYIWQRFR